MVRCFGRLDDVFYTLGSVGDCFESFVFFWGNAIGLALLGTRFDDAVCDTSRSLVAVYGGDCRALGKNLVGL